MATRSCPPPFPHPVHNRRKWTSLQNSTKRKKNKKTNRFLSLERIGEQMILRPITWFSWGNGEVISRRQQSLRRINRQWGGGGKGGRNKNILQSFMVGSGKLYRDSTKIRQPPRPPAINDGGPLCTSKWFLNCQILNDNFDICMTHFFFLMVISSLEL